MKADLGPPRPALRYHGGKWILAPWLLAHFPQHRIYVEPFGGGASVLLRKQRSYGEIYNDLDSEVVNFFRVLRDHGDRLRELLTLTPFSNAEFCDAFHRSDDPIEQARRTAVRSFMGFGSASVTEYKHSSRIGRPTTGFRANSNRSGTTPAHDWVNYADCLPALVARLRSVVIDNRDAAAIMRQHDGPDTLFYCDPPYVSASRDRGADYAFEMTDADHLRFCEVVKSLTGMVIVSGYPSRLYDDMLSTWTRVERAALADGARPRVEVIWINQACTEALRQQCRQPELISA